MDQRKDSDEAIFIQSYDNEEEERAHIRRNRRVFIFHTTFIILIFLTLIGIAIWLGIQYT